MTTAHITFRVLDTKCELARTELAVSGRNAFITARAGHFKFYCIYTNWKAIFSSWDRTLAERHRRTLRIARSTIRTVILQNWFYQPKCLARAFFLLLPSDTSAQCFGEGAQESNRNFNTFNKVPMLQILLSRRSLEVQMRKH